MVGAGAIGHGVHYSGAGEKTRSGRSAVLVDETAENVVTLYAPDRELGESSFWGPELKASVRSCPVIVPEVSAEHAVELAVREDQQVVQALGTKGFDPALGVAVTGRRRPPAPGTRTRWCVLPRCCRRSP
jgi:hypothetical protein